MGKIDVLLVIFSLRANKKKAREKKNYWKNALRDGSM